MSIEFDLSRDSLCNQHYLEMVAEDFLKLTVIELADFQKSVIEQIKISNDELERLRNIEIERFKLESCTEDKLKGVLENPLAAVVPLGSIIATPGYKFAQDGSFVTAEPERKPTYQEMNDYLDKVLEFYPNSEQSGIWMIDGTNLRKIKGSATYEIWDHEEIQWKTVNP